MLTIVAVMRELDSKNMSSSTHRKRARVLIAHQSTIPHYRVRFYELLETFRPDDWSFDVVFDTRESTKPSIYLEPVDHTRLKFPILDVRTHRLGSKLLWQTFVSKLKYYDVVVTDTHLVNLSYLAMHLWSMGGKRHLLWGHVGDLNTPPEGAMKKLAERLKSSLIRRADHFLAYTTGQRDILLQSGYPADRITVLNNTIDTVSEREAFLTLRGSREEIREELRLSGCKVLLHVGRLIPGKRIELLLDAFERLHAQDSSFHLVIIGGGTQASFVRERADRLGTSAMTYCGPLSSRQQLAPYFVASELFVMPGYVGLAPLQALCYNLPVVAFDLPTHSPEFEYLSKANSVILPGDIGPEAYARELANAYEQYQAESTRSAVYASIKHLTLEAMTQRFSDAVTHMVKQAHNR